MVEGMINFVELFWEARDYKAAISIIPNTS